MLSQLCVNILNMPYLFLRKKKQPHECFSAIISSGAKEMLEKCYLLSDYSPENLIWSNNTLISVPYLQEKKHVCSVCGLFVSSSV